MDIAFILIKTNTIIVFDECTPITFHIHVTLCNMQEIFIVHHCDITEGSLLLVC